MLGAQRWVVFQDLLWAHTGSQPAEDITHGNAGASYARFAKAHFGVNADQRSQFLHELKIQFISLERVIGLLAGAPDREAGMGCK